jgi:hypothetical protein
LALPSRLFPYLWAGPSLAGTVAGEILAGPLAWTFADRVDLTRDFKAKF